MFEVDDRIIERISGKNYEVTEVGDEFIKVKPLSSDNNISSIYTLAWHSIDLYKLDTDYYKKLREEKINSIMDA